MCRKARQPRNFLRFQVGIISTWVGQVESNGPVAVIAQAIVASLGRHLDEIVVILRVSNRL